VETDLKNTPRNRQILPSRPPPLPSCSRGQKTKPKSPDWKALREARKRQLDGIESTEIHKLSVEAKLHEAGAAAYCREKSETWFDNFRRCGQEKFFMACYDCSRGEEIVYQCCQKWCPRCNWKKAMEKRKLLEKMTKGMTGVKHVVLTQKNFQTLNREKIMTSRKALFDLRRQKIFGKVSGGCASLEFTNEGNGWHMHWHLLIASPWIDSRQLAIAWGELVGQEFAIVKVMDVSEKSYLQEICKYVVDGSELAGWTPAQILEFIIALRGTRMFTVFGKFREVSSWARELVKLDKAKRPGCICGCHHKIIGRDEQHAQRQWERNHK
jgi:hypothetical protein